MSAHLRIERYGRVAQLAHWLTVLLLIGSFSLGFYAHDLAVSPLRLKLMAYHKWIGVAVFTLVLLRLGWRFCVPPPALPPMPRWAQRTAEITHRLLYLLLLATPLAGWLMSSAKGFQTVLFGRLPIPDLLTKNPPLGEALESVHLSLMWMLLATIALHVAAALKHQFFDRDQLLLRMLPGRS